MEKKSTVALIVAAGKGIRSKSKLPKQYLHFGHQMVLEKNIINLKSLKVFAGTGEPQRAEMTLDVYGEVSFLTDDTTDTAYGTKIGAKYKF